MNEQALKHRIKIIANEKGISFNECWKKLLLERFLFRLSRSNHNRKLIFKGGFLLAYITEIGRETVDLDFLLHQKKASENEIKKAMMEIIATQSKDGFLFHYRGISHLEQPHMKCPGYKVNLEVNFGRMRDRIHIDVGTGDIVSPTTFDINLIQYDEKPLFESQIPLLVYPTETIFAEKLETVISKGAINSRMKDYHDLLLLTREIRLIDFNHLVKAIKQTFHHRETSIELVDFSKEDLKPLDELWTAHLKNLGKMADGLNLPRHIQDVINEINEILAQLPLEYPKK